MKRSDFMLVYGNRRDLAIWKAALLAFGLAALFSSRTAAYGREGGSEPFRIGEAIREQRMLREADRKLAQERAFAEEPREIHVPSSRGAD